MTPAELGARLTITVPEAGEVLGIGEKAAYAAAARGEIPTLRLGRRLVVPVPKLLELVGVAPERTEADPAIEPAAAAVHPLAPARSGDHHGHTTPAA